MRQLISSGSPYEPKVGISRAVRVGSIVAVSGTAPLGPDGRTVGKGDPAAQARRCLAIIKDALERAGTSLPDDPAWDATFDSWWERERSHRRHWIVEVDGEVVGMVSVVHMDRMPRPGIPTSPWGYLHQLYVLPAHRDHGVGAALLRFVADECRADGYQQLVLNPTPRSVPFYRRLGYVETGTEAASDPRELQPFHFIRMSKPL